MVGDTINGTWNETVAVSLLIKVGLTLVRPFISPNLVDLDTQCADTMGILPELDERISWLPIDYAAKSTIELVNLPPSSADCPVYHILHPTHIPWSSVLTALQGARLDFKRVPRHEWIKVLRTSDPDERRNPSRKLLAFYEGKYGGEKVRKELSLCVDKTVGASRWLREAPVVEEGLVAKWVEAWRESGFLRRV